MSVVGLIGTIIGVARISSRSPDAIEEAEESD